MATKEHTMRTVLSALFLIAAACVDPHAGDDQSDANQGDQPSAIVTDADSDTDATQHPRIDSCQIVAGKMTPNTMFVPVVDMDGNVLPNPLGQNVFEFPFGMSALSIEDRIRFNHVFEGPTDAAFGDVDGDGFPDMVVNYGQVGQLTLLRNVSGCGWDQVPNAFPDDTWAMRGMTLVDLDGDGDKDLIVAGSRASKEEVRRFFMEQISFYHNENRDSDEPQDPPPSMYLRIFTNDGAGNFTEMSGDRPIGHDCESGVEQENIVGLSLGDVDGDGWFDIIPRFNNTCRTAIFYGGKRGNWDYEPNKLPIISTYTNVLVVDVDSNGEPDVSAYDYGQAGNTFLVHGDASWEKKDFAPFDISSAQNSTSGVSIGDVNGDGVLDVALSHANSETNLQIYSLRAEASNELETPPSNISVFGVTASLWGSALIDLDGDADQDLVAMGGFQYPTDDPGQHPYYWRNSSSGTLEAAHQSWIQGKLEETNQRGLVITDVNGDGRPDVVRLPLYPEPLRVDVNGFDGSWTRVTLKTRMGVSGVGARVHAIYSDGKSVLHVPIGSGGYAGTWPSDEVWIGGAGLEHLMIEWPDGTVSSHDVSGITSLTIHEPEP